MATEVVDVLLRAKMEANEAVSGVSQIQKALQGLSLPKGLTNDLDREFSKLGPLLKDYQKQLNKGFSNKKDLQNFGAIKEQVTDTLSTIKTLVNQANSQSIKLKVDTQALDQLQNKITNKTEALSKAFSQVFTKTANPSSVADALNKVLESTARSSSVKGMVSSARGLFDAKEYAAYNAELDKIKNKILSLGATKVNFAKTLGVEDATNNMAKAEQAIVSFFNKIKIADSKAQGIELLKKELQELGIQAEQLDLASNLKGADEIQNIDAALNQTQQSLQQTGQAATEAAAGILSMKDQVGQLQQSTQYFFSLRNMINLFKRGIDDAVKSVKELDAAMTETAVVTDFSVGDMWEKLPEYTANANALGATIKDMYESTTLYYQQGLNTEQSMSIAAETMKMARIAGLDAADATDKMTAALRGFNMEINEASAQRINDVYSNLAAKTASDTEELGSAMQRTASIAHSAGMSFEGTAAFLAQAIETTREPAENIGTAMKTIVARFQEMKKNPLEIAEVDGEEVSYNKVDAALQSIGVSLKDTNGQFRELDKVFLDISQRWDSLTQTQQRYIATTAAGSRQQSRFIAMMGDYERTAQLMDYANNSAGASNEQFEKTMDSLEAKLNKLHNAWQEFTMGIANNTFVKGAVDGLTTLFNFTNKTIDKLSAGSKTIKSVLSILTAFTGLKAAGRFANAAIGGLGGLLDPQSSLKQGFLGGAIGNKQAANAAQARMISDPIVNAINRLYQAQTGKAITKDSQTNARSDYKAFTEANSGLRKSMWDLQTGERFSIGKTYGKIDKLNERQQQAILQQLPGLSLSLQKQGIKFDTKDISKGSKELLSAFNQEINKGLQSGSLDTLGALKMFGTPADFRKAMAAYGDDYASAATEVLTKGFDAEKVYNDYLTELRQSPALASMTEDELMQKAQEHTAKMADEKAKANLQEFATSAKAHGANVANVFGKVGTAATLAGQGVAQLGIQLSSAGFETAGAMVTQLGYKLSSLGTIAASAGELIGKVVNKGNGNFLAGIGTTIAAHPYIAAFTALTAVIGGAIAYQKHLEAQARESAEEIQKVYSDSIKEADDKIASLEANKSTFTTLSKGVDEFGNNVSLTTEQYEEYLSTSKALADISPSLIKGYDAEGRAIIAKGDAIDKLIDKQKQLKEEAVNDYTNSGALTTNIEGVRASDSFKNIREWQNTPTYEYDTVSGQYVFMGKQIRNLNKALLKLNSNKLKQINKEISKLTGQEIDLKHLDENGVRAIASTYQDVGRIIEENSKDWEDKTRDGVQQAINSIGEDYGTFVQELQPLTEQIGLYLSSQNMDAVGLGISEEFVGGFNKGLEQLAMNATLGDWGGSRIQREAQNYATQFKALTNENSAYARTLVQIEERQKEYLNDIGNTDAINNYNNAIVDQINTLNTLANQYDDGTAAGKAFADMCRQSAADAQHFTEYGVASLAEGLNSLSSEFAYARGAEERFKEATKGGDYYTAAEQYKSIIDTVMDEKNNAGQGSLTAWRGATELLGANFVDSAKDWETVANQIERITPMFEDGANGVLAFNDYLVEAWETAGNGGKVLSKLGRVVEGEFGKDFEFNFENVNDHLKEFAEELHMGEGALAALIDKSRQWVPWDISDTGMIMSALRTSETSMEGKSGKLYTSESAFREEAYGHEVVGENYKTTRNNLEKEQNVDFLTVDKLVSKDNKGQSYANEILKDIGISSAQQNNTLANAVQAYTKLGFGLEDIQKILTSDGVNLQEGKVDASQVEEAYNEQDFAQKNPTVAGIANDTGLIASNTSAMAIAMGILGKDTKQEAAKLGDLNYVDELYRSFGDAFKEAKTGVEKEAVYNNAKGVISDYDTTIKNFKNGQSNHEEGSAAWAEYQGIINNLQKARDSYSTLVEYDYNKFKEQTELAKESLESISISPQNQKFLESEALRVSEILQSSDLSGAIGQLQQLQAEGNLTDETMHGLVEELIQAKNVDLSNLTYNEVADLLGQIIPVESEAQKLAAQMKGLSDEQIDILFNSEVRGAKQVNEFLTSLNKEFGDNTVKTQKVLVDAQLEVAKGNSKGASELLKEKLGLNEKTAETVTQRMEVAVETNIIGETDLQAVKDSIADLPDNQDVQVTVNYVKNSQEPPEPQEAGMKYHKTGQDPPDNEEADLKYNKKGQDLPDKENADFYYNKTGQDAPSPDSTGVKYYISYQEPPKTMHADVVYTKRYKGQNNRGITHSGVSIRSAASGLNNENFAGRSIGGKRGQRKQIALTGEKGFEIAWIPSEQRAVILGENGPEVANFPSDTVIYTNEQSRKILKGNRNRKEFNSYASGRSGGLRSSVMRYQYGPGGGGGGNSSSSNKANKSVEKTANKVVQASVKVYDWWESIDRRIKASKHEVDKWTKALDARVKDIRATTDNISSGNKKFVDSLKTTIRLNESLRGAATQRLSMFNKKYEKTVTWKNGKDEKSQKVDLSKFVYMQDGAYVVSEQAINSLKDAEQAKAIQKAAYEEIDKYTSKQQSAENAIAEAQDALAKYRAEIDNTFFGWKNELTKIYYYTSRIEKLEAKIAINRSKYDLNQTKLEGIDLSNGLNAIGGLLTSLKNVTKETTKTIGQEISAKKALIEANKQEVISNAYLTDQAVTYYDGNKAVTTTERKRYEQIKSLAGKERGSGAWWDELGDNDKKIYAKGQMWKYRTVDPVTGQISFDTNKLNKDIKAGRVSKELGDLLNELFKNAIDLQTENLNLNAEILDLERDRLDAAQQYKDQVEDIRSVLYDWENTLTKIYALTTKIEQAEKRVAGLRSAEEYFQSRRKAGYGASRTRELDAFRGRINTTRTNIRTGEAAITEQRRIVRDRISGRDIVADIAALNKLIKSEKDAGQRDVYIAERDKLQKQLLAQGKALKYGTVALNNDGTITANFNEDKLREAWRKGEISSEEYQDIEKYWNDLITESGKLSDLQAEQIDRLKDLYQELINLKQEYADRAKELREAYVSRQETQINNLKNLYTAIGKSFNDLISAVKDTLSKRRQAEDNRKTEQGISQQQQYLAALRANTSGGNQVQIAQLEKEIANAQQSYGRSIEDQLLDKISKQGSLAEKQRQRQIDLLSAQHEIAKTTGLYAKQINAWLSNPEKYKSNIISVLKGKEGWSSLTTAEKEVLQSTLDTTFNSLVTLPTEIKTVQNTIAQLNDSVKVVEALIAQIASGANSKKISAAQVKSQGLGTKFAKQSGISAKDMKAQGYTANQLKSGGYTAKDIKNAGYSAKDAVKAGYAIKDLKAAGYSAAQLRGAGASAKQLKDAGFSAKALYNAGYSLKQLKAAGYTAKDIKSTGASISQARAAGYSVNDVIKAYGTAAALKAGYSGSTIQKANNASSTTIQKAINANIKDKNVSQADMAGVTTSINKPGPKTVPQKYLMQLDKNKTVSGSITTGGKWIYGNSGSTLYAQQLDTKTGKGTGKVHTITIGNLTTKHFAANKKEATEALVYAITHGWGTKLNKNFKALVASAGIGGKQYELKNKGHNWYASVGTDGLIYQNVSNGVEQWNPATGKTTLSKYDKAKFLKIAKRNNGPSREYAQVLIGKKAYTQAQLKKLGVKQFLSGGLADFTGPAWLDGTSSKPELVLNAQDTKNFIALRDILSQALRSTSSINNSYGGDAMYEININVDHINNDYDVDKIAERVKRNIVKDSSYRNVTQVRKFK